MIRVALRGLAGRKLRAALTAVAIVLGVAMISGTFVLTDTINAGFHTIFFGAYKNTDAVITSKVAFSSNNGPQAAPGFPESLLTKVKALPDIAAAAGSVTDQATKIVDRKGKTIGGNAPQFAFGIRPQDQRFSPLTLVGGRWPVGPEDVAIDKATADKKHFSIGQSIRIEAYSGLRTFHISGIAELSSVSSIGGATIAIFNLPTAQRLLGKEGKLDVIRVQSKPGAPTTSVLNEIRPLLPVTAQVRDATAQAKQDEKNVSGFTGFIQKALLAFGGVALFVGAFVIANTLSITVAQRAREFATVRTLGASRRQVRRVVVLEALVVGVIASVIGLFVGFGLAKGLDSLFSTIGLDLPKAHTVYATRTFVVSLLVGVIVTLLASLRPARRAMRVPPILAVREGAVLPRSRFARFGPVTGVTVLLVGLALLCVGVFVHGISIASHLLAMGLGLLLMFIGITIFAPALVRPLASTLGWPAARLGGAAGVLARDNAIRNPSRTASTAAALMIGLALVTFVTVFAQGLRSGFESAVNDLFHGDYAVAASNFNPLTAKAADAAKKAKGVRVVSEIRAGTGRVFGKTENVAAVDADLSKVLTLDWYRGSPAVPAQLGLDGAFVDKSFANKHHLGLGSPVELQVPSGRVLRLTVKGIFKPPKGGSPFGPVTISTRTFDANYTNPENQLSLIKIAGGVSKENTRRLEAAVKKFPDAKVETEAQFKHDQEKFILNLLNLLYVLLGLSVVISLFGIVNTLVLTVFERTRELGMLRAVGMTRRQVRRMIRHESIITALIGATLGIGLGVFLGFLISIALSGQGIVFAVPYARIAVFVVAAVVVGLVAAIFPARRASRLNVLEALQYE
jgi:putative ABC transport system permease protein